MFTDTVETRKKAVHYAVTALWFDDVSEMIKAAELIERFFSRGEIKEHALSIAARRRHDDVHALLLEASGIADYIEHGVE